MRNIIVILVPTIIIINHKSIKPFIPLPKRLLLNKKTWSSFLEIMNPSSWCIWIYSSNWLCRKAILTSSYSNSKSNKATMESNILIELCFTNGENTSLKFMPFFCVALFYQACIMLSLKKFHLFILQHHFVLEYA